MSPDHRWWPFPGMLLKQRLGDRRVDDDTLDVLVRARVMTRILHAVFMIALRADEESLFHSIYALEPIFRATAVVVSHQKLLETG